MSRPPSRHMAAAARAQAREGAVTRAALTPAFPTRDAQADYWRAQLRLALDPEMQALGLVGPDDWKVYRDLVRHAEELADDEAVDALEMGVAFDDAVDAAAARRAERQRRHQSARRALAKLVG